MNNLPQKVVDALNNLMDNDDFRTILAYFVQEYVIRQRLCATHASNSEMSLRSAGIVEFLENILLTVKDHPELITELVKLSLALAKK